MAYHAKLSPSGADRWMLCPGSVVLSEGIEDTSSDYAAEGTAAHFLAAECLRNGADPFELLGENITVDAEGECEFVERLEPGTTVFRITDEMVCTVSNYVEFVKVQAKGGALFVEQSVPIGGYTGEEGATGSADAIVITADGELQIHDLKYGMGKRVAAENNRQLQMYALGAIENFALAYDFTSVRLFIHQVRLSDAPDEWPVSLSELEEFGDRVRNSAAMIYVASTVSPESLPMYLAPGEAQCQWCRAKATCPKLAKFISDAIGSQFEDITQEAVEADVYQASTDELSVKMAAIPLIEMWIKDVRSRVNVALMSGIPVPGYKLVQGRQGDREWSDAAEAEAMLKNMRLKVEEMYDLKLISPTTAEKLAKAGADGKPAIGPRQWQKVRKMIIRKPGSLSVAPASDKREEVKPQQSKAEDFDDLDQDLT